MFPSWPPYLQAPTLTVIILMMHYLRSFCVTDYNGWKENLDRQQTRDLTLDTGVMFALVYQLDPRFLARAENV